jgi:hypothetical protein
VKHALTLSHAWLVLALTPLTLALDTGSASALIGSGKELTLAGAAEAKRRRPGARVPERQSVDRHLPDPENRVTLDREGNTVLTGSTRASSRRAGR